MDDLRDSGGGGGGGFGFGGGGPRIQLGCGGIILLGILSLLFQRNLFTLLDGGGAAPGPVPRRAPSELTRQEEPRKEFITFVLNDAQSTWAQLLPQQTGTPYTKTRLALFRDGVQSACGFADSATGPFYCPGDSRVYIDLSFLTSWRRVWRTRRVCAGLCPGA